MGRREHFPPAEAQDADARVARRRAEVGKGLSSESAMAMLATCNCKVQEQCEDLDSRRWCGAGSFGRKDGCLHAGIAAGDKTGHRSSVGGAAARFLAEARPWALQRRQICYLPHRGEACS